MEFTISRIFDTSTIHHNKGNCVDMKTRKYYGISFCRQGQITYIHNGKSYVSDPGTAIILPKGESYSLIVDKTGEFLLINFDCETLFTQDFSVYTLKNPEYFYGMYEKLRHLYLVDGNKFKQFSLLYEIFSELFDSQKRSLLSPALQYITKHYGENITNERLAAECGISEVYFRKLFVKQFGMPPKQYILDLRINTAKQMLSEGVLKNTAIAEQCGFSSICHFSRLFKQKTGFTPTEYMKRNSYRYL